MLHHLVWIIEGFTFFFFSKVLIFLSFSFLLLFGSPLCAFPFYWNSNGSRVCVWPATAVIEPICRLAPVGLKPGLTALRWLNAFTMFLNPILFLFLPPHPHPTSLDNPPNGASCANEFFIEIDALSFHWVCICPECIFQILFSCSMTWQIYVLGKKKMAL